MPFNIKASGVTAISAFVLSFLIGFVSGGSILTVLLRAGILGAGFFILVTCAQFLLHQFLPELTLDESAVPEDAVPGSRLDISVDDTSDNDGLATLLASAGVDTGKSDGADSKTTGKPVLDQGEALRYNDNLEIKDHFDDLPDLAASDDKQDGKLESDHPAFNKKYSDVNPAKNYSPKDLASAITTMLKQ
ncbi:MAG: hypothetical protein LBD79_05770 [Treponema sp.]|jgi:hypothetical protein|nr:hypothetical protein [Treponema sp.]